MQFDKRLGYGYPVSHFVYCYLIHRQLAILIPLSQQRLVRDGKQQKQAGQQDPLEMVQVLDSPVNTKIDN
jgi:hypothetical protein